MIDRCCNVGIYFYLFFFFQAEDGIRDLTVTGVQTCALPICSLPSLERARWAKMSRISAVRSMTFRPSASEMLRSWLGESGSSQTTRLAARADRKSVV